MGSLRMAAMKKSESISSGSWRRHTYRNGVSAKRPRAVMAMMCVWCRRVFRRVIDSDILIVPFDVAASGNGERPTIRRINSSSVMANSSETSSN